MRIVSDVLLLSYLDKFGLSVTVEAGQALAVLYSEARLYKVNHDYKCMNRYISFIDYRIKKEKRNLEKLKQGRFVDVDDILRELFYYCLSAYLYKNSEVRF
jgi:hypothetical protein